MCMCVCVCVCVCVCEGVVVQLREYSVLASCEFLAFLVSSCTCLQIYLLLQ